MFLKARFIKSVYNLEDLPPPEYPEIPILGRSNAGKSSLINALLNQRNIAKVSSTPGFTQALNFFLIDDRFWLVDLPGYGFAKVPKEFYIKWKYLIEGYLQSPRDFYSMILIFDIRRIPDKLDKALVDFLKALNLPYVVVLNKIDKLNQREIATQKGLYEKELKLTPETKIFLTSCKEKRGLEKLRAFIEEVLKAK